MKFNLSEISGLIQSRRTITPEHYSTRKVHKEQIEKMLQNAVWAPNHKLTQPWRFHVYLEEGMDILREKLPELMPEDQPLKRERIASRLNRTSAVVVVCMEPSEKAALHEEEYAVACAIQNIMLTATAYGIGSFWATPGFIRTEKFNQTLNLSEQQRCLGIVYLGYVEGEWPVNHRKPLEYVTEWNSTKK
jgi:nitroreductase